MEWITKIFEALKLPIKIIWALFIIASLILFIPKYMLEYFGLIQFQNTYKLYISLVFIVSLVLIFTEGVNFLVKKIKLKIYLAKKRNAAIEHLASLDPKEKSVLREFFIQNQNTLRLPYDQPIIAGLINNDILKIIGNVAENSLAGMLISIEIDKQIRTIITPQIIDLPIPENNILSEEQKEFIIKNRPDFLHEIQHHENLFHKGWWRS